MSGPVETKVTAGTLGALVGPVVAAFLALLVAFGVPLSDAQVYAVGGFVLATIPLFVYVAAYRAPHTFRYDLEAPTYQPPAAQQAPDDVS